MGQRVINVWLARWKASWWELSQEDRDSLFAKVSESFEDVGGTGLVVGDCEWSTPKFQFFGVEEYPSVEALRKHIAAQREMGFSQHIEETYVVGTPWESEEDDS